MTEVIKVEDCSKNIGDYDIPIHNAIIIPDGATNGDMIKAMFTNAQIDYHEKSDLVDEYVTVFLKDCDTCQDYSYDWWDAPYNPPKQNLAPADSCSILGDDCPYDIKCEECEVHCSIERAREKLKGDKENDIQR